MKALLCAVMLAALGTVAARADVVITFDAANQVGAPGDTLSYTGTITNTGASTVYLNSDDLTLNDPNLTVTDNFGSTPVSIDAGQSSTDIDLFDVAINQPFLGTPGVFTATYTLVGGADGGAQDNIGQAGFSVAVEPEPASFVLLLTGAPGMLVPVVRRMRARRA